MQIVINIPKEYYNRVKDEGEEITHSMIIFDLIKAIENGEILNEND